MAVIRQIAVHRPMAVRPPKLSRPHLIVHAIVRICSPSSYVLPLSSSNFFGPRPILSVRRPMMSTLIHCPRPLSRIFTVTFGFSHGIRLLFVCTGGVRRREKESGCCGQGGR